MFAQTLPSEIFTSCQLIILMLLMHAVSFQTASSDTILQRQKRFIYYPNGGTVKLVIGIAIPVKLGLKQSMAIGWNLQYQYAVPRTTNDTSMFPPIVARSREKREQFLGDRAAAYKGIEAILNRNGVNGRACLLRSICENAMESTFHEANGLYGHLLHIALTPDYGDGQVEPDLDPEYLDAKKAGKFGVECTLLYPECRHGSGILDMISLLDR